MQGLVKPTNAFLAIPAPLVSFVLFCPEFPFPRGLLPRDRRRMMVDMANINTLRKSRAMFSERHGVPSDVNYYAWLERSLGMQVVRDRERVAWVAREQPSNCPNLAGHMHKFSKFAPWQVHSVVRNVFVGRVPAIEASALAHNSVGSPPFAIAISDGMYLSVEQCAYLWESSTRIMERFLADAQRGLSKEELEFKISEAIDARGLEERIDRMVKYMLRAVRRGELTFLMQLGAGEFDLPVAGVSPSDLDHRYRLQYASEQFIVAHELAHVILGDLGSTGSPRASQYASEAISDYRTLQTWGALINDSQRTEADADMFGFFELSYATSWEISKRRGVRTGWHDRSKLALLAQHAEGFAVASIVFYLLSALGLPTRHSSTHPRPDDRIALVIEAVLNRMAGIIAATEEPNEGRHAYGHGYYERTLFFVQLMPNIYRVITQALELSLAANYVRPPHPSVDLRRSARRMFPLRTH